MRARSFAACLTGLLFASCGGSSTPPPADPAATKAAEAPPAEAQGDGAADEAAKAAAAVEKITSEEAQSGTCDPEHEKAIDKLLADVEAGMKDAKDEDGKPLEMKIVGKKILALGPNAKSFEMSVTGRGTEVHVMAYGAKEVSMDVLVGRAAATTLRSPYQRSAAKELSLEIANVGKVAEVQSDSRQVTMKPGQPLVVKVTGQGCAGIVSFLKP